MFGDGLRLTVLFAISHGDVAEDVIALRATAWAASAASTSVAVSALVVVVEAPRPEEGLTATAAAEDA